MEDTGQRADQRPHLGSLPRVAARTCMIVGLAVGGWLAFSASASAQTVPPPAPLAEAGSLLGGPLSPVARPVTPVVRAVSAPVPPALAPLVAPVRAEVVAPVVAPVRAEVVAPVVAPFRAAVMDPAVRPMIAPAVAPVVSVVDAAAPVSAPVSQTLDPVLAPAADAAAPVLTPVVTTFAPATQPVSDAVAPSAAPVVQAPILTAAPGPGWKPPASAPVARPPAAVAPAVGPVAVPVVRTTVRAYDAPREVGLTIGAQGLANAAPRLQAAPLPGVPNSPVAPVSSPCAAFGSAASGGSRSLLLGTTTQPIGLPSITLAPPASSPKEATLLARSDEPGSCPD